MNAYEWVEQNKMILKQYHLKDKNCMLDAVNYEIFEELQEKCKNVTKIMFDHALDGKQVYDLLNEHGHKPTLKKLIIMITAGGNEYYYPQNMCDIPHNLMFSGMIILKKKL